MQESLGMTQNMYLINPVAPELNPQCPLQKIEFKWPPIALRVLGQLLYGSFGFCSITVCVD